MKPFPVRLLAALCIFLTAAASFAQSIPPPKNPVLHNAPAFASWTIEFKYKTEDKKPGTPTPSFNVVSDPVQTITVTKTNKIFREQLVLKSGRTQEKWIYNGIEVMKMPGTGVIVPVADSTPEHPNPDFADYSKSDFKRLEWVSLGCYKGVKSYQDKPAYWFESDGSDGKQFIAYLTVDTQLPLLCSDYGQTRFYTYNPSPTAQLVPPPDFLTVIDAQKKGLEALKFHASPP